MAQLPLSSLRNQVFGVSAIQRWRDNWERWCRKFSLLVSINWLNMQNFHLLFYMMLMTFQAQYLMLILFFNTPNTLFGLKGTLSS